MKYEFKVGDIVYTYIGGIRYIGKIIYTDKKSSCQSYLIETFNKLHGFNDWQPRNLDFFNPPIPEEILKKGYNCWPLNSLLHRYIPVLKKFLKERIK